MTSRVFLVRHGATAWSESGRHTSFTDLPLLAEGETEARGLAPRLAEHAFAQVLTSPQGRARRTAELAGFPLAEVDADLREWDYGEYEGVTTNEIRTMVPEWTVWTHRCPGGETPDQLGTRIDRVIGRVLARPGDTLMFGHGHSLRVLAARWLGQPVSAGRFYRLDTGAVSVLGWEREQPVILELNT